MALENKLALYQKTVREFKEDIERTENGRQRGEYVAQQLAEAYAEELKHQVKESEQRSWRNSLPFVKDALEKGGIPDDCYVLLEYKIPEREERIDCALAGRGSDGRDRFVIIELKQWSAEHVEASELYGFVHVRWGREDKQLTHPALQAGHYQAYLESMVAVFYDHMVSADACAYLHNYQKRENDPLLGEGYSEFIKKAQMFLASDAEKLAEFLRERLKGGRGLQVVEELAASKVQMSKKLIEAIGSELENIEEFALLGKQFEVYNYVVSMAKKALKENRKIVIIVQGGPGTGKSVIAVKALASLLKVTGKVRLVANNAAFRKCAVYELEKRQSRAGRMKYLFQWSGKAENWGDNQYDILLCDECQKLSRTDWKREGQVDDIIRAGKVCVFLGDDRQAIDLWDDGTVTRIKEARANYVKKMNRPIYLYEPSKLTAQFRCAGMDEYVEWLEETLQIEREGGPGALGLNCFDFRVMDSPGAVYELIRELDGKAQEDKSGGVRKLKARMVAGFAWPWTQHRVQEELVPDVRVYDENGRLSFARPWNDFDDKIRAQWSVIPSGVEQIGCAHTVLGMEFDYVGVLIGKDLAYDPASGSVRAVLANYFPKENEKKRYLKLDKEEAQERLDRCVKNIYRILMTRGMKGCYVYCCDKGLQEYLKQKALEARAALSARS